MLKLTAEKRKKIPNSDVVRTNHIVVKSKLSKPTETKVERKTNTILASRTLRGVRK